MFSSSLPLYTGIRVSIHYEDECRACLPLESRSNLPLKARTSGSTARMMHAYHPLTDIYPLFPYLFFNTRGFHLSNLAAKNGLFLWNFGHTLNNSTIPQLHSTVDSHHKSFLPKRRRGKNKVQEEKNFHIFRGLVPLLVNEYMAFIGWSRLHLIFSHIYSFPVLGVFMSWENTSL